MDLSIKSVYGNITDLVADTPLVRFYGVVTQAVHGESDKEPRIAFIGNFGGMNLKTGETLQASKCFLPSVASALLEVGVLQSVGVVDFAFDVWAKPAKNVVGHEYFVRSINGGVI